MSITLLPDIKGCFISWAKAQPAIVAICPAANIKGLMPTAAHMPTSWLTSIKTGGFGGDAWLPLSTPRLDVWAYGPTAYEAFRLARTVQSCLIPVARMQGGIIGFEAAGCRVLDVQNESSIREQTTEEGWPVAWAPYLFRHSDIPV